MGKKILILGTGAQGSTVARKMDEEPNVEKIILADYNKDAVDELVSILKKARGEKVDASSYDDVLRVAKSIEGLDLIVNALPLDFGKNALDACLEVKCNYQDFAAPEHISSDDDWINGIKVMLSDYSEKFKEIGKLAITGTGSAPGLICVATARAMKFLDSCDTIFNLVYEGVESKRFQPFWWSPITALSDMEEDAYAWINGELKRTTPFSLAEYRKIDYLFDGREVSFVEHAHDEPVYYGFNSKTHFKGVKNAYFKYGGVGIDFAKPLYQGGFLSHDEIDFKGAKFVPFDYTLSKVPNPPRFDHEIKDILDEGLISDTGAMVIEAIGKKDGKDIKVETHVFAPGLVDSYKKAGISAEMYLTGQGGSLFTKLFANDIYTQTGLISSDMLNDKEIDYYFDEAKKLDITLEDRIIEL